MKLWPWSKTTRDPDTQDDLKEADQLASDLEDRAADVERRIRERDPWAAGVLDALHPPRKPHAR